MLWVILLTFSIAWQFIQELIQEHWLMKLERLKQAMWHQLLYLLWVYCVKAQTEVWEHFHCFCEMFIIEKMSQNHFKILCLADLHAQEHRRQQICCSDSISADQLVSCRRKYSLRLRFSSFAERCWVRPNVRDLNILVWFPTAAP